MSLSALSPVKPLQVLLLEDSQENCRLITETLSRDGLSHQAHVARNQQEFKQALAQDRFDIILSDFTLPGYSGAEALALAHECQPETPFVLLSGVLGEEHAVEAMRAGATDYVLKSRLERLPSVVRRALREAESRRAERDISERERQQVETDLRTSEERLRAVWENSHDGMRLTDSAGRVLAVNEAYCRLVKMPREKLVGELFTLAYQTQEGEDRLAAYQGGFLTDSLVARHTILIRLWNSEPLELEVSNSFIRLVGARKLVLSICRDITERNRVTAHREALAQLGYRLSAARTARQAGEIIIEVADKLLGWDACTFDLYSAAEDKLETVLNFDTIEGHRLETPPTYHDANPSPVARRALLLGGQLILKTKPEMLPQSAPFGDTSRPSASILMVPVRDTHQTIGLLSLHSYRPKAYDARSLETLQTLADHCAGALNRIRVHEELQNAQQRLNHFLKESPAVIYSLKLSDQQPVPVWVSNYMQELLGFTTEQACQPDWWSSHVHPEDLPELTSAFRELPQRKRLVREYRIRHQDGSYRWVRDELRLVSQPDGSSPEILGAWVDITEGKALQEVQKRLATAAEQSAESILITDVRGEILYVNPAFERVSGYSRAEAVGKNPRLLKSGKHDPAFYRKLWETITTGDVWQGRITNQRKDGSFFEEDATISPVRDAGNRIVNFVAVKRDVTHETQLESQLRQAQKMEAIGQLAGGVAHDFNNLLLVMRGNAELLMLDADQLPEPFKEGLKQITSAAERAASLTRQLLAFSRKQIMQPQLVVLNDVIANLTKMLKRIIGEHIDLQCHYGAELPFVQADPGMLEQVLVNLVINARDAMPQGGQLHVATEKINIGDIYLRVNPEARPGQFVCLTVRDNGSGIPPEHLPRIFEPFFTTKQPGKGTGLGLATAYGIVKQHRGWIEVFSQVDTGTTFRIFLPAVAAPAANPAPKAPEQPVRGGSETVLLVEDEQAVRMITRRMLESAGYSVHEASSAREALEKWTQRLDQVALLLTDIVMPEGITGRDLADKFRIRKPGLKVIFMSGYSADVAGKDTEFFRRTKTHFLQKPCSSRLLLETVRRSLDEP